MRGTARARRLVIDHLAAADHLDTRVSKMALAGDPIVGIAEDEYHYAWKHPQKCTNLPAICASSRSSRDLGPIGHYNGDPIHRWHHTIRLYLWARGDGEDQVADRIELLANAVATELLARPALGDPGDGAYVLTQGDEPFVISYSTIDQDPDGASIAGAYLEFVVSMTETADIPPLGTLGGDGEIDLTVGAKDPA